MLTRVLRAALRRRAALLMILFLCGLALPAADAVPVAWPRLLQPGCLVRYRIETPPAADAAGAAMPVELKPVVCTLLVLGVNGDKLDLQLTVEGVGNTFSVVRDSFDPGALLGAPPARQELTVVETPAEFKPAAAQRGVSATRTVWKGDPEASEVVRSPEIPFGLASLKSGRFRLEVVDFSWGNNK